MERSCLESWLAQGLTLEQIGRRVGKDPSTVSWWLRRHGLEAVHAARHAPRGGLEREWLEEQVEAGLSIRRIAKEAGVSQGTVRHWLGEFGIESPRAARVREGRAARAAGRTTVEMTCGRHGSTAFSLEGRGTYRCLRCRSEAVAARRRKVKQVLVAQAGGGCALCGYDRYLGALQFHHVDPSAKSFGLSRRGVSRAIDDAREEVAKCILLCANCHAEVEGGVEPLKSMETAADDATVASCLPR